MKLMVETERRLNSSIAITVAVAALAFAGYMGLASGYPTMWSPLPVATALPTMLLWVSIGEAPSLRWLVDYVIPGAVGPILLLTWYPGLLSGAEYVPIRSIVGLVLLSALTIAHFVFGWEYGVKYQSAQYTMAMALMNGVAILSACGLLGYARRRRTFASTLVAHATVVAWLVWIAFPWLGELP